MQHSPGRRATQVAIVALTLLGATEVGAQAPQDSLRRRPWAFGVATGPTFFHGDEGNNVGLNVESTVSRRLGHGRTWLRAEITSHLFGAQRLYPCSYSVQSTCFSTMQRAVFGTGVSVQQFVGRDGDGAGRSAAYFTLGVQALRSARVAEKIDECTPSSGSCDAEPVTHSVADTDIGATIGAGHSWNAGPRSFFIEARLMQPLTRQVGAFTRYRLMPFTMGMRF